jgi:hypothetical protein
MLHVSFLLHAVCNTASQVSCHAMKLQPALTVMLSTHLTHWSGLRQMCVVTSAHSWLIAVTSGSVQMRRSCSQHISTFVSHSRGSTHVRSVLGWPNQRKGIRMYVSQLPYTLWRVTREHTLPLVGPLCGRRRTLSGLLQNGGSMSL